MASREKSMECARKIYLARLRIIAKYPFYGMLLMHIGYGLDESAQTAYTDGEMICFSPDFIDTLDQLELDVVLMHELLHVVLKHCDRGLDLDHELYNVACDIVVNSNVLSSLGDEKTSFKTLGTLMHKTPSGKNGYLFTAEEVYAMLKKKANGSGKGGERKDDGGSGGSGKGKGNKSAKARSGKGGKSFDTHDKWKRKEGDDQGYMDALWRARVKEAARVARERGGESAGAVPAGIKLILKEFSKQKLDWRRVLNDFVQEEISDYSFSPPDRRYSGDFFLPDFNDVDFTVKNVLFMVDTSASMSEKDIADMYSEIYGAITQFDGKLQGYVGFFDAAVVPPVPFMDEDEFRSVRAYGGGGTSFTAVAEYLNSKFKKPLSAIIVMTDGYAPFPNEKAFPPVPLLWILNNDSVTPPYGKILRIK